MNVSPGNIDVFLSDDEWFSDLVGNRTHRSLYSLFSSDSKNPDLNIVQSDFRLVSVLPAVRKNEYLYQPP